MILVIGSGVAGLTSALAAARSGAEVTLVTPGRLTAAHSRGDVGRADADTVWYRRDIAASGGSTALAQGGIAAAIGPGDTPAAHLADTVAAGAGFVDEEAASTLVHDGARVVQGLLDAGFPADREASGVVSFGLEAAHSVPRIVHAGGDRTGAVLHEFLVELLSSRNSASLVESERITLLEGRTAESLLMSADGAVIGAMLRDGSGSRSTVTADAVVLATGGFAALYPRSTNPASSRGEGIVMAAQAGAVIADLEFVQFHPTVLKGTGALISEAVRGAGAVLRDGSGRRFMVDRHPLAELAPRDVVSREIERMLEQTGEEQVWLDATGIEHEGGPGALSRRFPGITRALEAHGLDWTRTPIPVAPAAHYTMGGVASDLDGRSSVPGLFVAGEVAATGVHGANRLASNSLLEGLVFGERAAAAAVEYSSTGMWELNGAGMRAMVLGDVDPVRLRTSASPLAEAIAEARESQTQQRSLVSC